MGSRVAAATKLIRVLTCLVIAIWTLTASIAAACTPPADLRTDLPPMIDGRPVDIKIGFGVADVLGVDDVNQQLEIDFFTRIEWNDPRLADYAGCRFPVTEVWFPAIYVLNSSQLTSKRRNARDDLAVEDGGRVIYVNRFIGQISSYHNLARFPFDSQVFHIDISVPQHSSQEVTLIPDFDATWIASKLNIEGWDFSTISISAATEFVDQLQREVSVASVELAAQRNSEYYIYRVLLLLGIVVAMSWIIFWVPPGRYEFQIGIGSTAMLTSIAFNFSVASSLPPVGYLTVMDRLVIWAVLLIFLATAQALITARLVVHDREHAALVIDRHSRYLFPLLFLGGWAVIITAL